MPYTPEHKEKTHRRIIEAASQEFRVHGFEGVGISTLMGALQLTHGGFYAHFADKEALVAEAGVAALDESLAMMLMALNSGGIAALLNYYLSEEHRDQIACGCPLPALSAEVARRPAASREAFTAKLSEVFHAVAEYMPGQTSAQKLEKASVLFAAMAGAVALARAAVSDPLLSRTILNSMREHLLGFTQEAECQTAPS